MIPFEAAIANRGKQIMKNNKSKNLIMQNVDTIDRDLLRTR